MHQSIFGKAAARMLAPLGAGFPKGRSLVLGLLCASAPFGLANPALAQPLPLAQVPEVQDPVPVDNPVSTPDDETKRKVAELGAQLDAQRAELADLRAEFQHRLGEEKAAREAAQAQTQEITRSAVESNLKASPRVGGVEGVTLSGFLQVDFNAKQISQDQLNSSTGLPLNDDRFLIRRARLSAAVDSRYLAGIFELDANTVNGTQVRPFNVEATAKWPGESVPLLALTAGLFKIPFGFEVVQRDRDRLFAERSTFIRALFPGEYDLGARLAGGWRFVRYALAVQNGEPLGEATFPARDPNQAKDVTGRIGMVSQVADRVAVQAGFSGLTGKGFHKGVPPTKPTLTWVDVNENGQYNPGEFVPSAGTSGQPSQNFARYAVGADAMVSVQYSRNLGTTIYGEFARASNLDRGFLIADPYGPLGRDAREWGYYVAAIQNFGCHLQLGLRYDYYNPDLDSTDRQAAVNVLSSQTISTLSTAVAWVERVGALSGRIIAEYDVVSDHQGRDASGLPADLKNNVLTLRAEVAF